MVCELACLDILRFMHGRTASLGLVFFPCTPDEMVQTSNPEHSAVEEDLFSRLSPSYDLYTLEQSIRWLKCPVT
jgi:hypothetical protein